MSKDFDQYLDTTYGFFKIGPFQFPASRILKLDPDAYACYLEDWTLNNQEKGPNDE